jgi:hypothetical protein
LIDQVQRELAVAHDERDFPRSQPTEDRTMNVDSVGSSYSSLQTQAVQRTPEAAEVKKAGPDQDGDSDDSSVKAAQAAPAPTVNLNGQKIGQIINVSA